MPNHTTNILTVPNYKGSLKKLLAPYTKDDELDFEKIIPMPEELKIEASSSASLKPAQDENLKKFGFKDWYEWSIAKWGTKWDAYDTNIRKDSVFFQTAWSPPVPVIKELSKLINKELRLIYSDEGGCFAGELKVYPDGKEEDNCYESFEATPLPLLEELGIDNYAENEEEEE